MSKLHFWVIYITPLSPSVYPCDYHDKKNELICEIDSQLCVLSFGHSSKVQLHKLIDWECELNE